MLLSKTLNKDRGSSNSIENPVLVSYRFFSTYLKKLQVFLQVKSPTRSFVFVYPFPPVVTDGRIARCSFQKNHEISLHPLAYSGISG